MQTGTDEGEKPGAKETERDREAVRDRNKEAEISRGRKYKATCGGVERRGARTEGSKETVRQETMGTK